MRKSDNCQPPPYSPNGWTKWPQNSHECVLGDSARVSRGDFWISPPYPRYWAKSGHVTTPQNGPKFFSDFFHFFDGNGYVGVLIIIIFHPEHISHLFFYFFWRWKLIGQIWPIFYDFFSLFMKMKVDWLCLTNFFMTFSSSIHTHLNFFRFLNFKAYSTL